MKYQTFSNDRRLAFSLFLLLVVVALLQKAPATSFRWGTSDGAWYQTLAIQMASEGEFGEHIGPRKNRHSQFPPVTSILLVPGLLVFGAEPWVPGVTTLFIWAALVSSYFFFSRMLLRSSWLALAATVWLVASPATTRLADRTNSEAPFILLLLAGTGLYSEFVRRGLRRSWGVLAAGLLGLLPLCRTIGISIVPALAIAGIVLFIFTKRRHFLRRHLLLAGIAAVPVVLWAVRNRLVEPSGGGARAGSSSHWMNIFSIKNPYNPAAGHLQLSELPGRILERLWNYFSQLSALANGVALALSALLVLWALRALYVRLRRKHARAIGPRVASVVLLLSMMAVYFLILSVYSHADYVRFALPFAVLLPILVVWATFESSSRARPSAVYAWLAFGGALALDSWLLLRAHPVSPVRLGILVSIYLVAFSSLSSQAKGRRIFVTCALALLLIVVISHGMAQNVQRALRGEAAQASGYREAFRKLGQLEKLGTIVVGRKPGFAHLESGRRLHVVRSPFTRDDAGMLNFFSHVRPKYVVVTERGLMPDQRIYLFPFLERHSEAFPTFKEFGGARILRVDYDKLEKPDPP